MRTQLLLIWLGIGSVSACGGNAPVHIAPVSSSTGAPRSLSPVATRQLPPMTVASPPTIFVNQVGYAPKFEKIAVYKSSTTHPVLWEVVTPNHEVVASGRTVYLGTDDASKDDLHLVDFSALDTPASAYRLKIAGQYSHPFPVSVDLFSDMKYDALAFFYHQRSGIDIEMPYAGSPSLTRPAGHLQDAATPCLPGDAHIFTSGEVPAKYACDYTLDVSGGWYDAGDHGKYTVNGGATVWILLNLYERALHLDKDTREFGDHRLSIPENRNGVPDLLDEVRYELEFLLKMQVPDNRRYAGMLHHKIHDAAWTGLGIAPHEDTGTRYIYPVSTTATLNGAAVFAQAYRVFKPVDAEFADRCLSAALTAYAAARKYPAILASSDSGNGGGPYDDPRSEDEKYWATAELFVSTGEKKYLNLLKQSPFFGEVPSFLKYDNTDGVFTWKDVAVLGTLSLAVVPNELDEDDRQMVRTNTIAAANAFELKMNATGYRVPLTPAPTGVFPWGSNSNVINNLMIMGLAHDFTKDASYLDAMITGMGYLLGRNPMDTCYVTGYGSRPVKNPHHRFFAFQANPAFPTPPPGIFAGGPNSGIQDDYAQKMLAGCPPAKCYVDHVDSWSTNEIAINWNAALAWVTAYLDKAVNTTPSPQDSK